MFFAELALLCTSLFTGAAIYITFVEHPARLECNISTALDQWRESYKRATIMQAFLAVLGSLSGIVAWYNTQNNCWLVAVALLATVIPFTLIVIFPTNKELQRSEMDTSEILARKLLIRWGYLHAVRSGLSLVALLLMVFM